MYVYPVKSLKGISINTAVVTPKGFQYDRKWMLVNESGQFLTQRTLPKMALIATAIVNEHLVLSYADKKVLLPLEEKPQETIKVTVWNDIVNAAVCKGEVHQWLSSILEMPCKLVFMQDSEHRFVDPQYANKAETVNFPDGYPCLITNTSSLQALNEKLQTKIDMIRFRPNIVVYTDVPFDEDRWRQIRIASRMFEAVKPCARCGVPNVDPDTALVDSEPSKVLNTFRNVNGKIIFGQNLLVKESANFVISTGDEVEVL